MPDVAKQQPRYELFRLLGEPQRLKLLGLAAADELSVGELAELLREPQPNVSRHVHQLRQAGLLRDRHHGTRVYVRLSARARDDTVVRDAIAEGQRLCEDVTPERIAGVIASRDTRLRGNSADRTPEDMETERMAHVPVYAMALSMMVPHEGIALDAGTGDGSLLDLLAPSYHQVIAVDRSKARIESAKQRVERRCYSRVHLQCADIESDTLRESASGRVSALFASRVLHHTSSPKLMLAAFSRLLTPGGRLCIIDYLSHDDGKMREQRDDVWMGFSKADLQVHLEQAGFRVLDFRTVPAGYVSPGFDAHIPWFIATAQRS